MNIKNNPFTKTQNKVILFGLLFNILLISTLTWWNSNSESSTVPSTTTSTTVEDDKILIAAVGDISCSTKQRASGDYPCEDPKVADLIRSKNVDHLMLVGDIQYNTGKIKDFKENFIPIWSDLIPISLPTPGNHEYHSAGARGYYELFSEYPKPGYYTYDFNDQWRLISLNTNYECKYVWCTKNSEQYEWLEQTLTSTPQKCNIAMTHYPFYSSRVKATLPEFEDMYNLLAANNTLMLVSGHEHIYERLSSPVPQYIVGTGGKAYSRVRDFRHEYSDVLIGYTSGAMFIQIDGNTATTTFVSIDNKVLDTHVHTCQN